MKTNSKVLAFLIVCLSLGGCSTPPAKLTISDLAATGAEGDGYPFAVPRTVIKVAVDKDVGFTFTSAPLATASDGSRLQAFLARDSGNGFALTPTTLTSVTYGGDLVITSIGTQVTDNRKDAVDTIVGIASLLGAFAGGACPTDSTPITPFVIDLGVGPPNGKEMRAKAENNGCLGWKATGPMVDTSGMKPFPVTDLGKVGTVTWFPVPACKTYKIEVFQCTDSTCVTPRTDGKRGTTTVQVADGATYHRFPLPAKGKISLHGDFCGADVTNDGAGTNSWAVINQILSDVKTAKKDASGN